MRIERGTLKPGTVLTLGRTQIQVDDGGVVTLELFGEDRLGDLVGRTSDMRSLMATVKRAAQSGASVLILGETGTGKELIAKAIHEAGPRNKGPFETVDCGALIPTLIASELFGHEKGAFTGADQQHIGAFERADGGTLFLDEVGELPVALQTALLGAIERRSFRRLGGQKAINVDVRILGATNRDLRAEVNAGTFRQDLYYRLAVVLLRVPPLREHAGDIPLLVEHFLRQAGFDGKVDEIIDDDTLESLKSYRFPGNVRELRNYVEASLAMGAPPPLEGAGFEDDERTEEEMAAAASETPASEAPRKPSGSAPKSDALMPYAEARAEVISDFEIGYIRDLMERTRWNVSLAAREAKMNRSHLVAMMKRHGINR